MMMKREQPTVDDRSNYTHEEYNVIIRGPRAL